MIKSVENEKRYKYLGVLQFDYMKRKKIKHITTTKYYWRIRKTLKPTLNAENTIQAINQGAMSGIIRCRVGRDELRKNELEAIDWKARKLLTMCRSLHPRVNAERLHWKKKNAGKGLISVEERARIKKQFLSFYLKAKGQQLLIEIVCTLKTQKQTECVISNHENPKGVKTRLLQQHKKIMLRKESTLHSWKVLKK